MAISQTAEYSPHCPRTAGESDNNLWAKNVDAYHAMRDDLECEHLGKYVIVHHEKLFGVYETMHDVLKDAATRSCACPHVMMKVVDGPPGFWHPGWGTIPEGSSLPPGIWRINYPPYNVDD